MVGGGRGSWSEIGPAGGWAGLKSGGAEVGEERTQRREREKQRWGGGVKPKGEERPREKGTWKQREGQGTQREGKSDTIIERGKDP